MTENLEPKVELYAGVSEKDRTAVELMNDSGIDYDDKGPDFEYPTPYIKYSFYRFHDLPGVSMFIQLYKENNLPLISDLR
jgi:hypothetical protein